MHMDPRLQRSRLAAGSVILDQVRILGAWVPAFAFTPSFQLLLGFLRLQPLLLDLHLRTFFGLKSGRP